MIWDKIADLVIRFADWGANRVAQRRREKEAAKEKKKVDILKARARKKAKDAKESGKIYDINPEDYDV